jgi:signal transduction histidine kinase
LSLLYVTIEACLIALLGYFLLTRSIIRPIRRLSVAAEQVAAGRLDVSVPVTQEDEIGALGRDFNQMVERIRAAQGALEERLTELQQINQSLAQAQDELVRSEKLATLGRLATGIAHEVGNPLAAVMGLVELLEDRKGLDAAEMDDLVMRVRRELTRIHEIIRNLLDYARARDKTLRTFEVIAPVRAAVGLAQHHPRARQLSIEVIEPASLLRFTGDENKLAQVVLNLLLNAADATEGRGHVRCWVDHVEEEGQPWHRVHVADDGPGIAPEVKKRLFEPFFTTKPSGRGTGLGLAVCERIAAEHGGRITVASQPGRGATFTIWLPVLRRPA